MSFKCAAVVHFSQKDFHIMSQENFAEPRHEQISTRVEGILRQRMHFLRVTDARKTKAVRNTLRLLAR